MIDRFLEEDQKQSSLVLHSKSSQNHFFCLLKGIEKWIRLESADLLTPSSLFVFVFVFVFASIGSEGKSFVGFGGFSGSVALSESAAAASTSPAAQSRDQKHNQSWEESQSFSAPLSHDFRLSGEVTSIFKGFKKREPVTKVKSLQAFRAYIAAPGGDGDEEGMIDDAVLGAWSYYYQRLIIDNSRQVRLEASHAHREILVNTGKKDLQAALPRFIAQWLRSQFDDSQDVARSVSESLKEVLPSRIRSKAARHYFGRILDKLCEDLCAHESAFGDSALESQEDIRDRHSRVLLTSIHCIVDTIETLQASDEEWSIEQEQVDVLISMMRKCNFGKRMMGSRSPRVRQAAYHCAGRLALNCRKVIIGCQNELKKYIVGSFKEKDSLCYKSIFEMVIVVNKEIKSMWEDLNPKDIFWPSFYRFLRMSCYGSETFSYLALMPLLSTMPTQVWRRSLDGGDSKWEVLLETLKNLLAGTKGNFTNDKVLRMAGQCIAECFKFFALNLHNIAHFYLEQGVFETIEDMQECFVQEFLEGVFYPFFFKSEKHAKLATLGNIILYEICKSLLESGGSNSRKSHLLQFLTCNMKKYVVEEFVQRPSRMGDLTSFICNLEPQVAFADSLISPLVVLLVRNIEEDPRDQPSMCSITSLIDVYGKELSQNDSTIESKVTELCFRLTTSAEPSSSLYKLTISWLKHSKSMREKWPDLLHRLSGSEDLQLIGANLLSHLQGIEGISCKSLDQLVSILCSEKFVASNKDLFMLVFKSILLACDEACMIVSDQVVIEILLRLKLTLESVGDEFVETFDDGTFEVIEIVMNHAGMAFPKRLLPKLIESVTFANCLQSFYFFHQKHEKESEGSYDNPKNSLWKDGRLVQNFGWSADSELLAVIGRTFVQTSQVFVLDWYPKSFLNKYSDEFLGWFGKDVSKVMDNFGGSLILSQIEILVNPHSVWPLWIDSGSGLLIADGKPKVWGERYKQYATFLLAVLNSLESYDCVCKLSSEKSWIPIEFTNACIGGAVPEADVYKYVCILEEHEEEEIDLIDQIFQNLKLALFAHFEGLELLHPAMLKDNIIFQNMQLLFHWLEELNKSRLVTLFQQIVVEASILNSKQDLATLCVSLGLLYEIEKRLLQSIDQASCMDLLNTHDVLQSLEKVIDPSMSSKHLAVKGFDPNNLIDKKLHSSVLATQIVSEFLYMLGKSTPVLANGPEGKRLEDTILSCHFFDVHEAMLVAVCAENSEALEAQNQAAGASKGVQEGLVLLYAIINVQSQVLCSCIQGALAQSFSMEVAIRNLNTTLTRLAVFFEDFVECDTSEHRDQVLSFDFDVIINSSESALSLFLLMLAKEKTSQHIGEEDKDKLLKCCLRIVFAAVALHSKKGASHPILAALSGKARFFRSLMGSLRHASRTCLLEALDEANSWSIHEDSDGVRMLLAAYMSMSITCNIRVCVSYLLSTRAYLSLLARPGTEGDSSFLGNNVDDAVLYALTGLGIPAYFAGIVFQPGEEVTMESKVRAWALFSAYLKTLGKESLGFYCSLLRHTEVMDSILTELVTHLPNADNYSRKTKGATKDARRETIASLRDVVTNVNGWDGEMYAARGSATVYHSLLHLMPSSVCTWFTEMRDRQLISNIEAYTSVNETPKLIELEFESIASRGDLEVIPLRSKREVVTRYRKDDSTLELLIKLPSSFPLRPVEVEYVQKFGFGEAVLRKWLLSIRSFLRNQNGTIDDAIYLWYQNVEKQFDGVEECPICYSIIHTTDHTLPRLKCRTCNKKFHASCMYKWFSTNHKSTCPMCRTLW